VTEYLTQYNKNGINVYWICLDCFLNTMMSLIGLQFGGLNDAGTWLNRFPIRVRKYYPVLFDRKNNSKSVVDDMTIMTNKYKSKK